MRYVARLRGLPNWIRKSGIGGMNAFLILCLSCLCACQKEIAYPPATERIEVPAYLYEPTDEPVFYGFDNMALLEWGMAMRESLRSCNADKQALGRIIKGEGDNDEEK